MGSPLGAAKYNSLLQGAASLDRLGTTVIGQFYCIVLQCKSTNHVNDPGYFFGPRPKLFWNDWKKL